MMKVKKEARAAAVVVTALFGLLLALPQQQAAVDGFVAPPDAAGRERLLSRSRSLLGRKHVTSQREDCKKQDDGDADDVSPSADYLHDGRADVVVVFQKWKNELDDFLHKVSRPKRLTVSTHSAFSTIVTGFFFGAVVPCMSPGYHDNGLPRLYDFITFDNAFLAKTTGLMFALSAVTGVLRLPPNSTRLRRLMFESCAWATVLMYTLQDSNIFMLDGGYSLDVFDGPGWFVTFTVFVGTVISTLEYLVEGIAGSDEGREYLPFEGHRFGMGVVGTLAYLGISPLSLTIPPWFFDRSKDAFESIVVPGLHMVNGWNLSVNFIVEAYMGFGECGQGGNV